MHKPEGCTYPDCFSCEMPDCEYSDEDIRLDRQAENMRRRRAAKPEQYLLAARRRRALMELRDPGHYARLAREERLRKKLREEGGTTGDTNRPRQGGDDRCLEMKTSRLSERV